MIFAICNFVVNLFNSITLLKQLTVGIILKVSIFLFLTVIWLLYGHLSANVEGKAFHKRC